MPDIYYYVDDAEDWEIVCQRMCLVTASGCLEELALVLGAGRCALKEARGRLRFHESWLARGV